jgi:hypothetical protein
MSALIGFVVTCLCVFVFLAVFFALHHGSGTTTFGCVTHGAYLQQSTKDNGLHITIWCVKDGRIVP